MPELESTRRRVVPMRNHTFREYDDAWEDFVAAAEFFSEDTSEVLRRAIRQYVAAHQDSLPPEMKARK